VVKVANIKTKEEIIKIVKKRGILLSRFPEWQDDKDVALAAVKSFPFALQHVSERLKADKEVVLAAIKKEPRTLSLAAKEIYDNDDVREYAFLINKSAFIVDPEAFEEFEFQDRQMMSKVYRSRVIIDENGKRSWDTENFELALNKNPFYRKFRRYYQAEKYPIGPSEIRNFEALLLDMKKKRIEANDKKDEDALDIIKSWI